MDGDTFLRLLAAVGCGFAIGVSHDLRGKPAGMRTLSLVALGAALITLGTTRLPLIAGDANALSRVIQGVIQGTLTGIGFLGAGAILHGPKDVRGLTTAASVWVTAALGIVAILSPWPLIAVGAVFTIGISAFAHPFEHWVESRRNPDASRPD